MGQTYPGGGGNGGRTGRIGGTPVAPRDPVTVTMLGGRVTPKLVQLAGLGKVIPEVVIVMDWGDQGTLTITMKDVLIVSYQFSGGQPPLETFTLSPLSLKYQHGPAVEDPKTGPSYNLKIDLGPKWKR